MIWNAVNIAAIEKRVESVVSVIKMVVEISKP